jgi:hypothetical protein
LKGVRLPEAIVALAVFASFVAVGLLDSSNRQRQAAQYDSFSSYDYQRGGYQAWFTMLGDEGIAVTRYQRRPAYLNDSIATLIIANNIFDAELRAELGQPYGIYTGADLATLENWVKAGGRLIWLVDQATSLALPGGTQLTSKPTAATLSLPLVAKVGQQKDTALAISPSPLTNGVNAVLGTGNLRVPFTNAPSLSPLVADARGTVVGWYPLGKGSVIVVTDESIFENGRLEKADNARLAYNLATFGLQPGQTVAFEEWSHGYQSGNTWWAILPARFRAAFCICAAALLLLLFGSTWRFGPALKLVENDERTSFEYLTSVANLLERGGASRKAVSDLAQLAMHAAARSVGLPDTATAATLSARLRGGEGGDRRANDLVELDRIAGFENPSPAEVLKAAQLAISLRKEFSGNGREHFRPGWPAARRSA